MSKTDNWLLHDHSHLEDMLVRCQEAVETPDWADVERTFDGLVSQLKIHMALEEEVLFPAYESASHAPQGPTGALRDEHSDIVLLFRYLARTIRTREPDPVLDALEVLENRLLKHHEKEEDIFLPMAGFILRDSRAELTRKLEEFDGSRILREWDVERLGPGTADSTP